MAALLHPSSPPSQPHATLLLAMSLLLLTLYSLPGAAAVPLATATQQQQQLSQPQAQLHAGMGPVLVTGATGRTGSLVYLALRALGVPVRALVRNATKAKDMLDCNLCDETEGIYTGDITLPTTLPPALHGAQSLVILTSSYPLKLPNGSYYFPEGAYPRDIDWVGSNNQVRAALRAGVRHVLLVSSMGTTEPDTFLDKLGDGHALFYKLNGEADLMASGLPYTIVKPGGLLSTEGGKSLLVVGHDDSLEHARVTRADLAAVLVAALQSPKASSYLRFDLSSDATQPAAADFSTLFEEARAWGGREQA